MTENKLSTIPTEIFMQLLGGGGGQLATQNSPTGFISRKFHKWMLEDMNTIESIKACIAENKLRATNAIINTMIAVATASDRLNTEKNFIDTRRQLNDVEVEIKKEERDKLRLQNQVLYFQSKSEELDYQMKKRAYDEDSGIAKDKDRVE